MSGLASATPPPASPGVFSDKSNLLNSLGGASASASPMTVSSALGAATNASSSFNLSTHHQHQSGLYRMASAVAPGALIVDDASCIRPSVLSSSSAASTPRFGGFQQLKSEDVAESEASRSPGPRHRQFETDRLHRRQQSGRSRFSSPSHDSDVMVSKTLFKASSGGARGAPIKHSPAASSSVAASSDVFSDAQADRVKIPVRLPTPHLTVVSDPYEDLPSHLRRHGLDDIARDWEVCRMTVDYALYHWVAAAGGSKVLLSLTNTFNATHDSQINAQLAAAAAKAGKASTTTSPAMPIAPRHFTVPIADLDRDALLSGALPSHVLAVQSSLPSGRMGEEPAEPSMLVPAHAVPYTLQCVSLPSFAAGRSAPPSDSDMDTDGEGRPCSSSDEEPDAGQHDKDVYRLPVVSLRVPSPAQFPTTHRYIYTRDASALLAELLPMRHIARHASAISRQQQQQQHQGATPTPESVSSRKASSPAPPLNAALAIQVLSLLPTATLLRHARIVHRVWSNGVALGLINDGYWSTLDRAWDLLVAALACRKGRREDARLAETRQRFANTRVC